MTKIRKLKRKKKYRYNVNRKRLNKKRLPVIESATVKQAWNPLTSSQKNFKNLGLVYDVNQDIKYLNTENISHTKNVNTDETSTLITNDLEKNARASRGRNFRFSKDQVNYLTYLLEKYGNDYKAMSKDKKNYLQYTWKQIRSKINLFKSIPDHYNEYIRNKNIC